MKTFVNDRVEKFEKELRKVVVKCIKQRIDSYPNYFKETLDMDNIFESIFDIDINTKKTQDDLANFTNPYIVRENGINVYRKELTSYSMIKYMISHMRIKSVEESHKHSGTELNYNSFKLEPYFVDILGEVIKKFKKEYDMKFLTEMLLFSLGRETERDNLFIKLSHEEMDSYIKLYEIAGMKADFFNTLIALKPEMRKKVMETTVSSLGYIYLTKIGLELRDDKYMVSDISDEELKKLDRKLYSHKKVKDLALERLKEILVFIEKKNLVAPGLRDMFLNNLHNDFLNMKGISYYERDTLKSNKLYVENELDKINDLFNNYREKKLNWRLSEDIFEKSPAINYIKINKEEYNLKARKPFSIVKGIVEEMANTILKFNEQDREKLLFKSMRFVERGDDLQILFNMNEQIPLADKVLLINDVEDLILRVLKNDFEAGFWEDPNKNSFEFDVVTNIKGEFENINREHSLWVKIKEVKREEAPSAKKKKI